MSASPTEVLRRQRDRRDLAVETPSPIDPRRQRVHAWLDEVASASDGSVHLPEGVEIPDLAAGLHEREAAHLRRVEALMHLTACVGRRSGDATQTLRTITETLADAVDAAKVSVWRCGDDARELLCIDLYDRSDRRHGDGAIITANDFPSYFGSLASSDLIVVDDVRADPITAELLEPYLIPRGVTALLDAALHVDGRLAGVICCEHIGPRRRWSIDEKALVLAVANLVSLMMETEQRNRARAALRASEQRFRNVASAVTDTIWDWDLVADTVWWNDGIESQFGHRLDAMAPGSESWTDHIHPDDRERILRGLRAAIDGADEQWSGEYRFLHGDGRVIRVQDTGVIMRDDTGRATRMVGGMIDVTARHAAQTELVRARQLAEEASRVKTEFLANMSHEIRTPLTAVLGFSDLLMDPTLSAGDRLDYVQSIRRNGAHLLALIDDVLDLSSMDAKVAGVRRVECSLHHILNEVASMMQVRASYKGLAFTLVYETPIPATVLGDPDRVRQILVKLVGNAVKFTDSGEIRVVARLRLGGKAASSVEVDVIDTGIGIANDDMPKVFQPFWQANATSVRRHGGSGLGLPICLPLAKAMGGEILVRSEVGKGSVFTLRLPHALDSSSRMLRHPGEDGSEESDHAPDVHAADETSSDDCSCTPSERIVARILLAEDGPDNQMLISTMLRRRGFEVTIADNGVDAVDRALLAAASGRPFHVILMDMQMPRLDGYGATALLRSRGYRRPIFALTAHAMPEERKRCLVAGCDEFLSKPVTWPLLLSTIDSYLQREEAGDAMGTELTEAGEATGRADDRTPIHSTLAGDPDMAELVAGFVERLPGQVVEIREALHCGDQDRLRRLAHQLKGAGGSYGFDIVSECAARVEQATKAEAEAAVVSQRVEEFEAICARVRSGTGGSESHA